MKIINLPLEKKELENLKTGEELLLNGFIYTARDQAHKRLMESINKGEQLPINLKDGIIYYCGPTETPPGKVIGSSGPTTSSRMDEFTPALIKRGLAAMIGKGTRSEEVVRAIEKYKAVYFLTYAGCGALLSTYIKNKKLIAYGDLGPEAIYRLKVKNFPVIVAIDTKGRNLYAKK